MVRKVNVVPSDERRPRGHPGREIHLAIGGYARDLAFRSPSSAAGDYDARESPTSPSSATDGYDAREPPPCQSTPSSASSANPHLAIVFVSHRRLRRSRAPHLAIVGATLASPPHHRRRGHRRLRRSRGSATVRESEETELRGAPMRGTYTHAVVGESGS